MRTGFRISSLVPSVLVFDDVSDSEDSAILAVRSEAAEAQYPLCATTSRQIHSRYIRYVADLPSAGRKVRLRLLTRRFTCEVPHCRRRIFAERFGEDIVALRRRRAARLEYIVHHLGLALGGRPAASFAKRLMLPVSNDTLLRAVRRRTVMPIDPLLVVGIDDWAFRRNHRYGTIVCDLERRRIVTLLPDRETATVRAWLSKHPAINIVSRDRGGGCGEAAAKALSNAIQVADRWHLMENASAAFLDAVRRSMNRIRTAIGATISPELLTWAEKLRYQGYLRRQDSHAAIAALVSDGVPPRRSSAAQDMVAIWFAKLAAAAMRMCSAPVKHPGRASAVPGHAVVRQLSQRCRTLAPFEGTRLQGIAARGGGMGDATAACRDYQPSTIAEGPRRQDDSAANDDDARPPNQGRDRHACRHRTKFPMLADAQALVGRFHAMIRRKAEMELQSWIDESKRSLIASFSNGIANAKGAVHAAITQP